VDLFIKQTAMELKEIKDLLDRLVMGDLFKGDVAKELGLDEEDVDMELNDLVYDVSELNRRTGLEWNDGYDKLLSKYAERLERMY
jgi:hypothetical protein